MAQGPRWVERRVEVRAREHRGHLVFRRGRFQFFGLRFVGQPLTGVRFNAEKGRLEQYFEKMGFYTLTDDPQHTVRLLAYGSYACQEQCSPSPPGSAIIGWIWTH